MAKTKTKSFNLELKLNIQIYQEHILNKRFEIARQMYNSTLSYALKQLNLMKQSKAYKEILDKYIRAKDNVDKKLYSDLLTSIRMSFSLSEYQLHDYIKHIQHNYKMHIDSMTAQKIASTVWKAISDVLFKKGKKVEFKKFGQLTSVEGKSNGSEIKFKENILLWNGLKIPVKIRKNDLFIQETLENHKVKYCRIVKKTIREKETYYVQLIMEGVPPTKRVNSTGEFRHTSSPNKRVGLDIGTSTLAISSKYAVELKELAPNVNKYDKGINRLLKYLDRSRRSTNPDNFNANGTIKRGIRLKWTSSRNYIKALYKIKELYRLKSQYIKQSHCILCNNILTLGNEIYVEEMNFKALARRSKKTTISKKTGRFNIKKTFLEKHFK